jgi:hypothetical protein
MFQKSFWNPVVAVTAILLAFTGTGFGQVPPPFENTIDTIPPGWTGPTFELSKDYPTTLPSDPQPWKAFDFKTQPAEYIQAVLAYGIEGNEAVQWRVQDNAIRKWYHAPGLLGLGNATTPASGREFIHGLTRERVSPRNELNASQDKKLSNWAVGFFNPIAAFTVGKVWANPSSPDTAAVKFEDGALAFKLLFTSGTDAQVPFLANSMKWTANIDLADQTPNSTERQPRDVLLLQVDVAVRDMRNDDLTGWVFGTFIYRSDASGATPLQRLVPVGLMWGNDPDQTWANMIGNPPVSPSPHIGWKGRLNGPVDNPRSSCLSCHARAVVPYVPGNTVPKTDADADDPAKKFFTNTKAGEVYDGAPTGSTSLDYSLQLAVGVRQFPAASPLSALTARPVETINYRSGEPEEPVEAAPATKGAPQPVAANQAGPADSTTWFWGAGAAILIGFLFVLWMRSTSPPRG